MFDNNFYSILSNIISKYGTESGQIVKELRNYDIVEAIKSMNDSDFYYFREIVCNNLDNISKLIIYVKRNKKMPRRVMFDYSDYYSETYIELEDILKIEKNETKIEILCDNFGKLILSLINSLKDGTLASKEGLYKYLKSNINPLIQSSKSLYTLKNNLDNYFSLKAASGFIKIDIDVKIHDFKLLISYFSEESKKGLEDSIITINDIWYDLKELEKTSEIIELWYKSIKKDLKEISMTKSNIFNYKRKENNFVSKYTTLFYILSKIKTKYLSQEVLEKLNSFLASTMIGNKVINYYSSNFFTQNKFEEIDELMVNIIKDYKKATKAKQSELILALNTSVYFDESIYEKINFFNSNVFYDQYVKYVLKCIFGFHPKYSDIISKFDCKNMYKEICNIFEKISKEYSDNNVEKINWQEQFDSIGEKKLALYFDIEKEIKQIKTFKDKELINIVFDSAKKYN